MRRVLVDSAYSVNAVDRGQRGTVAPVNMDTSGIVHKGHFASHPGRHVPVRVAHFNELYRTTHGVFFPQPLQNLQPDLHGKHSANLLLCGVDINALTGEKVKLSFDGTKKRHSFE